MDLVFDRGDATRPRGHALAYFHVDTEPDKLYATYLVILPVKADLTKYVPPFLASHLGGLPLADFSAFAMPPVPEPVEGYQELERLSRLRDDDLVRGGSMFSFDLPRMMDTVNQVVQTYAQLYADCLRQAPAAPLPAAAPAAPEDRSYQVNEVLYSLMSEGDKLAELARLLGKLRFAQEGKDTATITEVSEEIATLGRHLPEAFQVPSLLAAARDLSARCSRLTQLYLDRCFRLSAGDTSSAQALESQIKDLQQG
ncbi:MAG: hypothetical protein FJ316_11535 [SAR202 cluster bacterium]|nr:hypothetical protein [SAR202 cluster bacterium]